MANQVNPTYLKDDEKISKKVLKEIRQEQQQLILDLTEQQIVDKFSDKNLDRENEKIKLISGAEISISGFKAYINEMVQQYSPVFPKEFYREIFRLMGWNISESELYLKPPIVGRYTNDIIYGRFPREILPTLQILNPYIRIGMRAVKHFQWFTDNGQQKLKVIIQEAINEMKESNNWYEFRAKYARKYGVPFQLSLFTENNIII
jgi:hypothetical protein